MKRLFPIPREFKKKRTGKRKCPCNLYSWSKTKFLEAAWWGGVWTDPLQTESVVRASGEEQRHAGVSGLVFGNKQGFWWLFRPSSWDGSLRLFSRSKTMNPSSIWVTWVFRDWCESHLAQSASEGLFANWGQASFLLHECIPQPSPPHRRALKDGVDRSHLWIFLSFCFH